MQRINVIQMVCRKPLITTTNYLVSFPMLVLVCLVECLRMLRDWVHQSVHQENAFRLVPFEGYGIFQMKIRFKIGLLKTKR